MGPTYNGRLLPRVAVAAIALLLAPLFARGQPSEPPPKTWQEELPGKWCDLERGCTHWWTIYDVVVFSDSILITQNNNRFIVFWGEIRKPRGDWIITVQKRNGEEIKETDQEKITVLSIEGVKRNVKGKIEGKITAGYTKIIGGSDQGEIEISIPVQISDATIEGNRIEKDKDKDKDIFEGEIKLKVESPAGPGTLKGTFSGTFKGRVEAPIKGTYFIPPWECSEAGRPLSDEEEADLKKRHEAVDRVPVPPDSPQTYDREKRRYQINTPGRYRSETEKNEKGKRAGGIEREKLKIGKDEEEKLSPFLRKENPDLQKEKLDALIEKGIKKKLKEFEKERRPVAYAQKTRSPRPAELLHTRGTFMRKVSGTVSAIEPATITLDIPPVPVLDHKCSVIDELPKRTLKLVKQHDAVR